MGAKPGLIKIMLALSAAAFAAFPSPARAGSAAPRTMPAFSLPDLQGKIWSSSDFLGKALVVDFWATWCATCKETVPKLAELSEKYKGKGLTVIGITVDKGSEAKIAKAAKKLGINYLILRDKENSLGKMFGFTGIPSLYVYDRKGNLKTAMPGYDPDHEAQLDEAAAGSLN